MEEIWKYIKDYEGLYQVSNKGRIKSLQDNHGNRRDKIMNPTKDNRGYLRVPLSKNKRRRNCRVHRLVAESFIPNPFNKPCIDHINSIKTDNRSENLQWCTIQENNKNPIRMDKIKSTEYREKMSKLKSGVNNPFYGKHHTEETKEKIRKANLGNTYRKDYYNRHKSEL